MDLRQMEGPSICSVDMTKCTEILFERRENHSVEHSADSCCIIRFIVLSVLIVVRLRLILIFLSRNASNSEPSGCITVGLQLDSPLG